MELNKPRVDMSYIFGGDGSGGGGGGGSGGHGHGVVAAARGCARAAGQVAEALTGKISRHYSFRRKLSIVMMSSPLGRSWDVFQVTLSLLSCFLYVASTYDYNFPSLIDWVITILFTIDYAARFYISVNRLLYPFTFFAIVDLIACLPVYLEWAGLDDNSSSLRFVRFLRVLRVLRIVRAFRMISIFSNPASKALVTLALSILCIIFLGAGIFNVVEDQLFDLFSGGMLRSDYIEPAAPPKMFFLDACYYMVVTIFTVGYGDYFPITTLGRSVVIFFIVLSIVIFPILIDDLRNVLASISAYRTRHLYDVGAPHVLVLGACEAARPHIIIRDLLAEFFHHQRTSSLPNPFTNAMCILLGSLEPPEPIVEMLSNPLLHERLKYIRASAFRREDLMRVAVGKSRALFLVCDASLPCGAEAKKSDTEAALRAIMVKAHAPLVPMIMLVHDPQTALIMDTGDFSFRVASAFEWRAGMLASTALMPGFAGLMTTLVRSATAPTGKMAAKRAGSSGRAAAADGAYLEPWQVDCAISAASRIAVGPLPSELDGISFRDVAGLVFELTGGAATAIAVSELPALTTSSAGMARIADTQVRFANKTLLAEDLLRSMAFLPQEAVIDETRSLQMARQAPQGLASNADDGGSVVSGVSVSGGGGGGGGAAVTSPVLSEADDLRVQLAIAHEEIASLRAKLSYRKSQVEAARKAASALSSALF